MSYAIPRKYDLAQDAATKLVADTLGASFEHVQAYRYNSASLRVCIVDPRFAGLNPTRDARCDLVDPILDTLPEDIQSDIIFLLCLAPDEVGDPANRLHGMYQEFLHGPDICECGRWRHAFDHISHEESKCSAT